MHAFSDFVELLSTRHVSHTCIDVCTCVSSCMQSKVVKNSIFFKKFMNLEFFEFNQHLNFLIYSYVTNIQLRNIKTAHEFFCPPSFQKLSVG